MDKIIEMRGSVYYYIATFLFLLWFVGYLFFDVGAAIHFIFLAAVVILVLKLLRDFNEND